MENIEKPSPFSFPIITDRLREKLSSEELGERIKNATDLSMKQIKKKIKEQQFIFDYRKAIYWEDTSSLILSDVHVGKLNHFQKNGIPIPSDGSRDNLVNIKNL